jgi:hypothetical protein
MSSTLRAEYFQRLYDESTDPWRISDGWYEQRKRALVLAALPLPRFAIGFEPGCSNGELTVLLAGRCDRLIAWDIVEGAVNRTRERTIEMPGVEIRTGGLPDDWPDETADLIVLSEVGYYLDETDLTRAVSQAKGRLVDGGTLLAVHWRHDAVDYPLTGDRVHEIISAEEALFRLGRYCDEDVLIDVFRRGDAASVARVQGLL